MIESGASSALYDSLATRYEEHFAVPHRRAYDDLAWELVQPLLPPAPGRVVDIGCGIGRWARRLLDLGHHVVGIEPAPRMAAEAKRRLNAAGFELIELPVERVELPAADVDLVLATGSLQYTSNPFDVMRCAEGWLRPGGAVAVVVDSLLSLVIELLSRGHQQEAMMRLQTRTGTWVQEGFRADHHLFDADGLGQLLVQAGFLDVEVHGLLVGWSVHGRERMQELLQQDWSTQLAEERRLSRERLLADAGKQLIGIGRVGHRPVACGAPTEAP